MAALPRHQIPAWEPTPAWHLSLNALRVEGDPHVITPEEGFLPAGGYGRVEALGNFRCDVEQSGVNCTDGATGGVTVFWSAYRPL
jgi:hypothetical protein